LEIGNKKINNLTMRLILTFLLTNFVINIYAQETLSWWKKSDTTLSVIEGQAWSFEMGNSFQRLPPRAEALVRKPVWDLSQQTAGLSIRFVSNAPEIIVRYKISGPVNKPHIPSTAVSGVDLYASDSDGLMHWASGKYSFKDTVQYTFANLKPNDNFHKLGREYQLFLPLFNTVSNLEIGVPIGSLFKIQPARLEKPIVVYGTSIAHGACASRPGMAWTNILSRKLDRTVINLGFSGNGRLENPIIDLINEIDARVFILDCLPNLISKDIDSVTLQKRIIESVKSIRSKNPETPILLTEHAGYTDGYMSPIRQILFETANKVLNVAFTQLRKEGMTGIYLLSLKEIGINEEAMVDGTHPNDLGMMLYALAYEKKLREIFMEPVGKFKTQIPIRQRRTPGNFDWEARHYAMLQRNKTEPNKVLFIGNSITHNWGGNSTVKPTRNEESWQKYIAPYGVRNMGFGADRIENVLWRLYHDELEGITPEKIIISIGTNNLRVNSNEEIIEGLRFLVQVMSRQKPQSKIILLGIYPRRDQEERILLLNKAIRTMIKSEKLEFEDIGKVLLQKDGKINEAFFNDGLHPKPAGYDALGKLLEGVLKK
jgi:lysophospholipase L1-like esterase